MKSINLNRTDAIAIAYASAGLAAPNPYEAEYKQLWALLYGEDKPMNSVLTYLGNKLYLPKVYQTKGAPVLVWGTESTELQSSEYLAIEYTVADTGYNEPHAVLIFSATGQLVAEANDLCSAAFPVGIVSDKGASASFLSLVKIQPKAAFGQYVREPDPTTGIPALDKVHPDYRGPVTVTGCITRTGSPQYGGKDFSIAVVEVPDLGTFTVRVGTGAQGVAAPIVKRPMSIAGEIGETKYGANVYQRLVSVNITPKDLDLPQ